MIIESSNYTVVHYQRERKVWENEYILILFYKGCYAHHKLLVTVGEHSVTWQGNRQKFGAALVKTGHCVQAMKQALSLIERIDRDIVENKMNN